jgi:integrase
MKLNDIQLKNLKPKEKMYRRSDGGNLYIEVHPNGSKYWRLFYRFNDARKQLAFGVYPEVSLKEARDKRDQARRLIRNGQDPNQIKKQQKLARQVSYENNFEAVAKEWHKNRLHTWQPKHADNILKRLSLYLFPVIGALPIKEITPPELLHALIPIENEGKHEMAHRILQSSSQIFRYAVATGRADRDITFDLRGALKPVISKNFARLSEKQLPEFLKKLNNYDIKYNGNVLTKLGFKLLVLTFVRSGEIRGAKWGEIDLDKKIWRIPAERMKMKDPHLVPLSKQSIKIIEQVKEHLEGVTTEFLLPSQQSFRKTMSENTFLRALEIMEYKGIATAHGFRATASTILNENGFKSDVIERQLAHVERDQVRAAYNHAEYLQERIKMMQWWADYLEDKGMIV